MQGIVIWAGTGSDALILWCADNGGLVYVSDRRRAGDPHLALSVGDFVDFRIETVGAMRTGHDLRYRSTGAGWIQQELGRSAGALAGPVLSPHDEIARLLTLGSDALDELSQDAPANDPARDGTGTG